MFHRAETEPSRSGSEKKLLIIGALLCALVGSLSMSGLIQFTSTSRHLHWQSTLVWISVAISFTVCILSFVYSGFHGRSAALFGVAFLFYAIAMAILHELSGHKAAGDALLESWISGRGQLVMGLLMSGAAAWAGESGNFKRRHFAVVFLGCAACLLLTLSENTSAAAREINRVGPLITAGGMLSAAYVMYKLGRRESCPFLLSLAYSAPLQLAAEIYISLAASRADPSATLANIAQALALAFPLSVLVVQTLITQRQMKRQTALVEQCEASLRQFIVHLPLPVFYVDRFRTLLFANKPFQEWYRKSWLFLNGRHLRELFGESAFASIREPVKAALEGGVASIPLPGRESDPGDIELLLVPDGETQDKISGVFGLMLKQEAPQRAAESEPLDTLTVQRYLSEVEQARSRVEQQAEMLRRQSDELAIARDDALAATRAKSSFLANMSHELRTPLNGIVTMADLLCDERELTDTQKEYAEIIKYSSSALLTIISDVLDFSKIEANKLTLSPHPFELLSTLKNITALLEPQMNAKEIVFVLDVDAEVPSRLIGDSGRLRQVIINLLGNAIKFTSTNGAIVLRVSNQGSRHNRQRVLFSLADTGIGIAEDKLDKIFGAFDQEDDSTTRHYGGTGLGLSISRRLVELMGGALRAKSRKDVGSIFYFDAEFELPVAEQHEKSSGNSRGAGGSTADDIKLRVLVVEDNLTNQRVMSRLLQILGHQPIIVSHGLEALDVLADPKKVDLVLMDCHMPKMDGFTATREIRRSETAGGRHIPILGLTAATTKAELDECLECGMDAWLTKPVPKEILQQKIREFYERCAKEPTRETPK